MKNDFASTFVVKPAVSSALQAGRAVVALESTVITHGLPYPENLETAMAMEDAVRQGGAVPATISILAGKVHVGLTASQLEYLAGRPADSVRKCSRRDLPLALSGGEDGSTTVAATTILAHRAGIELFATGGIGGVHRGHPFDVSADLNELGRTAVTVVCSGAKAILDLPATMEVLETQGVPIIGYSTEDVPAFFTRHSGLPVTQRVDEPRDVASMIQARRRLGLNSGLLVVVPVPQAAALDAERAEKLIVQATQEADAIGIAGPAATPWLLQRMSDLSDGQSIEANVALLKNNGRVAAEIAAALAGTGHKGIG